MSIPWPFSITSRFKAVHLALEPECPFDNEEYCPEYMRIMLILEKLDEWESYRE